MKFPPEKLSPFVDQIVSKTMVELSVVDADPKLLDSYADVLACVIKYTSNNLKFCSVSKTLTDIFSSKIQIIFKMPQPLISKIVLTDFSI